MNGKNSLSIWFFTGVMLTIYGVIILIASIPALLSPLNTPHIILANLHADFWWSLVLLAIGILFLVLHWPGKHSSSLDEEEKENLSE